VLRTRGTIHPGAADFPDNGIDEDCAGGDRINLDRDNDAYNRPQDCNDVNPRINPGARDTPGDAVDDDCDGTPAPYPRLTARLFMSYTLIGRATIITRLAAAGLPPDTTVRLRCRGRGCPFTAKPFTPRRNGSLTMTNALKGRKLPAGTRIEVAMTRPQSVGSWTTYVSRVQRAPARMDRCLMPQVAEPSPCPL
jgi:Putative metal-binding motif